MAVTHAVPPVPSSPAAGAPAAGGAEDAAQYQVRWLDTIPFFAVHALAIAGAATAGWSWGYLALTGAVYALLMFGITGGLHRYFSHRSFRTGRVFQFVLGVLATLPAQKGVLWWSAHHRRHHKYSDLPEDTHSPVQRGFWWSHVLWILVRKHNRIHWDQVRDLARYPELRFLQRFELAITAAFGTAMYFAFGGWSGLVWGYFVPIVLAWHITFTVNSICHIFGARRYQTSDDSRNNPAIALLTFGEGWHNNHHYYQRSTAQGFYWWEIDVTYYALKALSWIGLVSDVTRPPRHVREARAS